MEETIKDYILEMQSQFAKATVNSGWSKILRGFLLSTDMYKILAELHELREEGKRFTPQVAFFLRPFIECPYDGLKMIILEESAYKVFGVACGSALDCRNTEKEELALRFVNDALQHEFGETFQRKTKLRTWSQQGVLLLNASVTTQIGYTAMHNKIWYPFIAYLLDTLNLKNPGLVLMDLTMDQVGMKLMTDKSHLKIGLPNPVEAINLKRGLSEYGSAFRRANNYFKSVGQKEIIW